jgi:hypothetical protein
MDKNGHSWTFMDISAQRGRGAETAAPTGTAEERGKCLIRQNFPIFRTF